MKNEWNVKLKVISKKQLKKKQKAVLYEADIDCITESLPSVINRMLIESSRKIESFENLQHKS